MNTFFWNAPDETRVYLISGRGTPQLHHYGGVVLVVYTRDPHQKWHHKYTKHTPPYSLNVKEWKTPLFTFRAVLHMALQKEWWLFHSFRGVSLQDRVKNHSKRCKIQSKRVEDHSKKSCPSYGSSKECFFHSWTLRV